MIRSKNMLHHLVLEITLVWKLVSLMTSLRRKISYFDDDLDVSSLFESTFIFAINLSLHHPDIIDWDLQGSAPIDIFPFKEAYVHFMGLEEDYGVYPRDFMNTSTTKIKRRKVKKGL